MDDIFEDMFDESAALSSVDTGTGKQLSQLVRSLRNVEQQIEDAENHIKSLKQEKHRLSVENIPALMDEMGTESFTTDEGVTVAVKNVVHASLTQEKKEEAFAWLRKEGLDDIIKNDVVVTFGKGEDNIAGDFIGQCEQQGLHTNAKTYIHPSTLKAFVKERVSEGKSIDLDLFGAYIANVVQIRRKA